MGGKALLLFLAGLTLVTAGVGLAWVSAYTFALVDHSPSMFASAVEEANNQLLSVLSVAVGFLGLAIGVTGFVVIIGGCVALANFLDPDQWKLPRPFRHENKEPTP
jgi:hypothetical protein